MSYVIPLLDERLNDVNNSVANLRERSRWQYYNVETGYEQIAKGHNMQKLPNSRDTIFYTISAP